ncbi:hypothetical protein Ait01nite_056420 [Actinoplanes italicus]|uniref:Uncharacterized protein n=1 Tax=Actinoplanes italicus TaxID=113567 RepID=A0A2T0K5D4_9ACTN|nr:hypothetical protein [Actinoplanes italicus]PRX18192.1 hypothetical protein CLV67_11325 [Actinoplanes italicus]GIE32597.1 hypothetical protein Ait01nite_056420 [Actinoplanes italicus]
MSAFGPALFVSRADGAAMSEDEQAAVLALVRDAAVRLRLTNDERKPAAPRVYDYDGYEPLALGVLLYSGYGYRHMPDEIRKDQDEAWAALGDRVAAEIDRAAPGLYRCTTYAVED